MIAIVDCNNFYASCERVFRPELRNKPVVILSNNDGCVIAFSEEAKALGVCRGDPYFQRKDFFRKNGVHEFSSNYALYGDMSGRVMDALSNFTPEIELYSIDEAFLNLSDMENLEKYASKIRKRVYHNTGIPVSVGVAPTKTLAKVANKLAKRSKSGHLVLDTPETISEALSKIEIGDVWGIGRQYERKLNNLGIYTARDLTQMPDGWINKEMTVVGLRLVKELRGIPCLDLELIRPRKKGICCSRQFGKPTDNLYEIREALAYYATSVAKDLRKDKSCSVLLTVFIETNPFKEQLPQHQESITVTLPVPSNSTSEIVKRALSGLDRIYRPGYLYKRCGVLASGIVPEDQVQGNLFYAQDWEKRRKIDLVFDHLNAKHGRGTVTTASEGVRKKWNMRREKLSPDYTTNWNDIITVKL